MNLHHLRLFCAVVRHGSVTRAAAELFVTQPTVSIQIRRLEKSVGLRLLERQDGRLVPTRAGAVLHASALRMLDLEDQLQAALAKARAGEAKRVAVGVAGTALAEVIHLFKAIREEERRVDVVLNVSTGPEIASAIWTHGLDLGVVWLPLSQTGLVVEPLARVPYVLVASPLHELARRATVPGELLQRQRFLVGLRGSGSYTFFLENVLRPLGLEPSGILEFGNLGNIKQVTAANLGIGLVPAGSVDTEVREGRLHVLEVPGLDLKRPLVLAYRHGKTREPPIALVADRIRAGFPERDRYASTA